MLNLLLETSGNRNVWENFVNLINDPLMIVAMVVLSIGIATVSVASSVARAIRKAEKVQNNDSIKVTLQFTGIGMVLLGFIGILIICVATLAGV